MTTWGTLKPQIARKVNDPDYATYTEDLLLDMANDALISFAANHTGLAKDHVITGDGEAYEFDLPADIVANEVFAVHWGGNTWLRLLEYWPRTSWSSDQRRFLSGPMGYILWPTDTISFTRIPSNGQEVTMHYVAHYPPLEHDESPVTVPKWALEPIKLYTAGAVLEIFSVTAGEVRQYNTKRDSGHPEHNPMLRLSQHYMRRYWEILAQRPVPQYSKLVMSPEVIQ